MISICFLEKNKISKNRNNLQKNTRRVLDNDANENHYQLWLLIDIQLPAGYFFYVKGACHVRG